MKTLKYIIAIVLLIFIIYFININNKKTYDKDVNISVYNGLSSVLYFIAKDKNYFKENGLNIKLKLYTSGKEAVDSLLKNEVLYANASEFVAVKNSFNYDNFSILASTAEASVNGIMVKKNRLEREIDIKNKNIAASIGSSSEYYTGVFLEHIGLSIKDVNLYNLNANQSEKFISDNNLDGFFTWEPFIYNTMKKNTDILKFFPLPKGNEFYFCLFVNNDELNNNIETSENIIKSLIKAEKWMNEHPQEFKDYVVNKFNFSKDYYNYIESSYNITISLSNSMNDAMKNQASWLIDNNLIGNKESKNYLNIINKKVLQNIDASLITIREE